MAKLVDVFAAELTGSVRFTPAAVGKYAFYCSKGLPLARSHRERGMEGLLDVVE